ncbi:MAG: GNAT family N-acetyltransferase [Lachnospiraceae bacterium]|nr:GNAT family N-acetyltransferase [Lachnospiraceae bacterium]
MVEIKEYFSIENQAYWLEQIKKSDWGAGQFLYKLLKDNELKKLCGEKTRVLMLVEEDKLVAFGTLAEKDDIQPTDLTPWVGFVYTFPEYRGHRYAGELLAHAEKLATEDGKEFVYISTNHEGLYEKYGYAFYQMMKDIGGEDSRVYRKCVKE